MLSSRKADREGHSADTIADALSRMVLAMRFRDRGEEQLDSVANMLSTVFDGMVQGALNSCIVTAYRGYGNDCILNILSTLGLATMCFIPNHF